MNCKPGDLAIVVQISNPTCKHHIGKVLRVVEPSKVYPMNWYCEPRLYCTDGRMISFYDGHLKPIRDQPGEDETLTWAPVPSTVEV